MKSMSVPLQVNSTAICGVRRPPLFKLVVMAIAASIALAPRQSALAAHGIEFVAEQLPGVAMDNRFATLPLWSADNKQPGSWQFALQGAAARTGSGGLALGGPMWSAAARTQLNDRWSFGAFGFHDPLKSLRRFNFGYDRQWVLSKNW